MTGRMTRRRFEAFVKEQAHWLPDYALFMAIKDLHDKKAWYEWEDPYRLKDPETIAKAKRELADDICFHEHIQYWFLTQWVKVKAYANEQGIRIIGDMPIYVAIDSADAWNNPQLFQMDEDLQPTRVAGCPPDAFSDDGQLWGNPLYDWDYHKKTGYAWWISRVSMRLYCMMCCGLTISGDLSPIMRFLLARKRPETGNGCRVPAWI